MKKVIFLDFDGVVCCLPVVAAFLTANLGITSYVVIDDDMDMGPIPRHRWTYVSDGWRLGGLQDAHVVLAAAALGLPLEATV